MASTHRTQHKMRERDRKEMREEEGEKRWAPTFSLPLDTEHPTRPDHHLGLSFLLWSRFAPPSARQHSPQQPAAQEEVKASPKCEHCGQPETIKHVILSCSQYDSAGSDLFATLGFRPPDNHLMEICLGRTSDRKLKGRKSTAYDRASASFLLEIDRLRPHLRRFSFQPGIHQWHLLWPFPISLISWAPIHNICTLYERSSWCLSLLRVYNIHSSFQKKRWQSDCNECSNQLGKADFF